MKSILITIAFAFWSIALAAQNVNNIQMPGLLNETARKTIRVPDIMGYKTLKCDFHIHTIFSDGSVWPTIRVDEAWQEGLDAIAITDHIERNPSKKFVGGDDNSSYETALPRAQQRNIILIRGGEITRKMPPGHFNALFLDDVNLLDTDDYMDAFKAASQQGAFIIWNHPGWKAQQPDSTKWWPVHTALYEKGWMHGMEVFNEKEWYPVALDWCKEKELAVISASDIHGITAGFYNLEEYHRPMTLVLAKERTEEAIREALFDRRTIAWFGNNLAGKPEFLKAFFEASVIFQGIGDGKYMVKNLSDVPFFLNDGASQMFTIPANGETMFEVTEEKPTEYEIENLLLESNKRLKLKLPL